MAFFRFAFEYLEYTVLLDAIEFEKFRHTPDVIIDPQPEYAPFQSVAGLTKGNVLTCRPALRGRVRFHFMTVDADRIPQAEKICACLGIMKISEYQSSVLAVDHRVEQSHI